MSSCEMLALDRKLVKGLKNTTSSFGIKNMSQRKQKREEKHSTNSKLIVN